MMAANADNVRGHRTLTRAEPISAVPHIVIAEDQPAIQDLLYWTLYLAGYHPTVCTNRHTALTWADKHMTDGDASVVMLLDLSLLGKNEAEDFLGHLRAHWQATLGLLPQIIVLTTNPQVSAELARREHVLQKPFRVRELLALIRQVTPGAS
ncbi:MAG: hypothetical protein ACRDIV_14575 [Ktedonobacteraceae bacterium]